MEHLSIISAFLGSWLLVAGPIYQASIELGDEDIETVKLARENNKLPRPPKVSPWWWLFPPLKIIKEQKRHRAYEIAVMRTLADDEKRVMLSFINKATGWIIVAAGGLLLAIRETYDLTEHFHWNLLVFVIIVILGAALSLLNTIIQVIRTDRFLKEELNPDSNTRG